MTESDRSIEKYLASVSVELQSLPKDERDGILDDLRLHINEGLKARCGEREPAQADVSAVLAQMDPPSAFRPESGATKAGPNRVLGTIALIVSIMGLAVVVFALIASVALRAANFLVTPVALISPSVLLQLIALALGLCSRGDKRGKVAIFIAVITFAMMVVLPILGILLNVVQRAGAGG